MGRLVFLALIIFRITVVCNSQNLLLNGNFENTISKVGDYHIRVDSFYALEWFLPTECTVDIFRDKNVCNDNLIVNYEPGLDFCVNTFSGNYCIGLCLINHYGYMEHIAGKLLKPLIKNSFYKISFYIKFKANKTSWASSGFGYKFSSDSIVFKGNILEHQGSTKSGLAPFYYHLFKSEKIFSDFEIDYPLYDTTWIKVESLYEANGGEKFITFGKFSIQDDKSIIKEFERLISKRLVQTDVENIHKIKSRILQRVPVSVIDETPVLTNYYFLDSVQVLLIDTFKNKNESCPFCVDLDSTTDIPSKREYNNLFDDKGLVRNVSILIVAKLAAMEKLIIQFGKNKEIILINDKPDYLNESDEMIYQLVYPVRKLRGNPLKWFVEKTSIEDIARIENQFGKSYKYNNDTAFGKIYINK